jgi:hypothetical protein
MTGVSGMVSLLRTIANRLENGAGELRKDFLLEVADKMEQLEEAAKLAGEVVVSTPRKGDGAVYSKVPRLLIIRLTEVLNKAGRYGPNGNEIEHRRS